MVCSGKQKSSLEETQLDLFEKNAPEISSLAAYAAEFNPKAIFCIATPPINALVPMVSEVMIVVYMLYVWQHRLTQAGKCKLKCDYSIALL